MDYIDREAIVKKGGGDYKVNHFFSDLFAGLERGDNGQLSRDDELQSEVEEGNDV